MVSSSASWSRVKVRVLFPKEPYLGLVCRFSSEFSPRGASKSSHAGGQDHVFLFPCAGERERRFSGSNGTAILGIRFAASSRYFTCTSSSSLLPSTC